MPTFHELGLKEPLLRAVDSLGFTVPTPVQEAVIPFAMKSERDLVALAQTGTGKTAAFGLPLLNKIDTSSRQAVTQGLILCPTRELCLQVAQDLTNYAQFIPNCKIVAVYGGARIDLQLKQLRDGAHVIVATPGRLIDILERRGVSLDSLSNLVLDEADEMLNMGFKEAIDTILESVPDEKSVWLFSATMSKEIRNIASNYMTDAQEMKLVGTNESNVNIEHVYYTCRADDRYAVLKRVVDATPGIFGLIFCRTKAETKDIAEQMMRDGYNADALHGDLTQDDRDRVMNLFRERTLELLVATDVAARGIDVSDISHVIHYGLPDDNEVYTHRSGRTGRAGKQGKSIVIVSTKFESRIREVERITKSQFQKLNIPSGKEVCEAQLLNIIHNIHTAEVHDNAIEPYLPQIYAELNELSKEDLIKRFASVEFNRFLVYYKNAPDLNYYSKPRTGRGTEERGFAINGTTERRGSGANFTRLFANIGGMDGVTPADFIKKVSADVGIPSSSFGDIAIKRTYMHFDIANDDAAKVKTSMSSWLINNRKVRVDNADSKENEDRRSFGGSTGGYEKKSSYDRTSNPRNGSGGYKGRDGGGQRSRGPEVDKFLKPRDNNSRPRR